MQMLPMILPSGAVLAHSLVIKVVNENPDFFDFFSTDFCSKYA